MAVLAHPDDESLGVGGTLARYAREGVETFVVTATRGQRGRYASGPDHPGPDALGRIREAELRAAARALGVCEVRLLDYPDADLDRADSAEAVARIVAMLRRVRPQVVITFDPFGAYGHPDHIAICQFTTAAVLAAADASYVLDPAHAAYGVPDAAVGAADAGPSPTAADVSRMPAHRVAKLYYMVAAPARWAAYQHAFKRLVSVVDGIEREAAPWPEWSITTRVDTSAVWPAVWEAVRCHHSQIANYERLAHLPPEEHAGLWGSQEFYRALSLVNGGRARENDLFDGVR
jgi:LmbE family N-acetylglucosaminyl deacetylase